MSDPGLWVWREDGTGTGTGDMHPATAKDVLGWLREHGMHAITSDLRAGVESGTIKGEVVELDDSHMNEPVRYYFGPGTHLVIYVPDVTKSIGTDTCPTCEGGGRYAWGDQKAPLELGPNVCDTCGGIGVIPVSDGGEDRP